MPYKIPECLECGVCCEKEQKMGGSQSKRCEKNG